MNLDLDGKVTVVTGGAKGIGAAICYAFAEEGAQVVVLDHDRKAGRVVKGQVRDRGGRALFLEVDLCDAERIAAVFNTVRARLGPVDILVNNAGGNDGVGLDRPPRDFAESLNRNLIHYYSCTHFAAADLRLRRGCIVNVGSKISFTGQGGTSGYAASKGAIHALTREWAADFASHGVRVNCVVPAEVITPMYEEWLARAPDREKAIAQLNSTVPLEHRTTTPEEIAQLVVFLASAKSSHTTGELICVDGGYVHLDRALTSQVSHLRSTR